MKTGKIFVISAPSGAGKTTLLKKVFQAIPQLVFSVSATTRKPRHNERDGIDYHFVSKERFQTMMESNELAEWQEVHGNYYGTPVRPIRETVERGKSIVLDIDVYGKKKFDAVFPENIGVLILPPSPEELERRLRKRGTESEDAVQLRLTNARKEIEFAKTMGRYEYVVVNNDFDHALQELLLILRDDQGPGEPKTT